MDAILMFMLYAGPIGALLLALFVLGSFLPRHSSRCRHLLRRGAKAGALGGGIGGILFAATPNLHRPAPGGGVPIVAALAFLATFAVAVAIDVAVH